MTAKPVPEHISDERIADILRQCEAVELAECNCQEAGCPYTHTSHTVEHLTLPTTDISALLTELEHRREAEAGTAEEKVGQLARMIDAFAFDVDPPRKKDSESKEYGRQAATALARRILVFLGPGEPLWHDVEYLMSVIDFAIEDGFDPDEDGPLLDYIRAQLKAVPPLAASPSSPASGVRVNPLRWELSLPNNVWVAKSIIGVYHIHIEGGRHQAWMESFVSGKIDQWDGPDRGDLYAAQADADAHYSATILSAIGEQP